MAVHVRNLQLPTASSAGATSNRAWYLREALLAGRWTENSNNGDAAWASALNLLVSVAAGPNGFAVDATKPREIYSPSGVFLPTHVDAVITLLANNDQNRGLWKIVAVLDANHALIDAAGWFPQGWITETGIAARVTTGTGLALTAGAWVLMDSPVGYNVQIRIGYTDSSNVYLYARPRGKLADATEIAGASLGCYYMQYQRLNCCIDGSSALFFTFQHSSNSGLDFISMALTGYLLDADAADVNPYFVLAVNNAGTSFTPLYNISIRMLDSVLAQIECYATTLKIGTGKDIGTAGVDLYNVFSRRLLNGSPGYAAMRSPWVVLNNTAGVGACVRGRLPMIRSGYLGFERMSPLDALGNWTHLGYGVVIPRNGPQDPLLMWPTLG